MPKPGSPSSGGSGTEPEPLIPGQKALEAGNGGSGGSGYNSESRKPALAPRRKLTRTGSAKDSGSEPEPLEPEKGPKRKGSDPEAVSPAKRVRKGGPAPVPDPDDLIPVNRECIVALNDWDELKISLLYYLKESGIHGKGLFALQQIPKGTIIMEYTGDIIALAERDDREQKYLNRKDRITAESHYFMYYKKDKLIDATFEGKVSKYINHSCSPNCVPEVISTTKGGVKALVAVITAIKRIPSNAELTYDYALAYERDSGRRVECQCGAPNCRKVINKVEPPMAAK